jgi:hypothetical protein
MAEAITPTFHVTEDGMKHAAVPRRACAWGGVQSPQQALIGAHRHGAHQLSATVSR